MIFTDFAEIKPHHFGFIFAGLDKDNGVLQKETKDFSTPFPSLNQKTYFWPSKFYMWKTF